MSDGGQEALGGAEATTPVMESDFSPRKIRIATVALLGTTFATSILPFMALGYVLTDMCKEFGWTRAEFLLSNSFLMVCGAFTVWALGRMTDKIGARPIIIIGTLAVGIITLLIPHIQNRWQFYALFALLGVFGSSGASYAKVITSLFTQNRGKATAIFGAEGTVARALIPMAIVMLIAAYHWRGMFTAFGIVILAIVPILFFGLDEPGTYGGHFSLSKKSAGGAPVQEPPPRLLFEGMSIGEAWRDKVFWLMLGGGLVSMVVANGVMANTIAAMTDKGFSQKTVGGFMSIGTIVGLGGVALGGYLMDKVQTAKIGVPFHVITALGAFLLMIVTPQLGGKPMLFAAIALGGFSMAAALPMTGYFLTRFFGLKSYAEIYGFMSMIQAFCMGVSAPAVGWIYDTTHSYTIAFAAQIVASLISAAVFLILPAYRFSADIGAMPAPPKTGTASSGPAQPAAIPAE
jgi:MFS family permease